MSIPPPAYTALGSLPTTQVPAKLEATEASAPNPAADGVASFRKALGAAEQAAMQTAVAGADPHAMVEALATAELVLDTATTVRDRVVEAYQELLRMPV